MSVFGFSTAAAEGNADIMPIVKYDARAGRFFRIDRIDVGGQYTNEPTDITADFAAIVDFENVETGWLDFATGGAPVFALVPIGQALPPKPTPNAKNGIRFMLKLSTNCTDGTAQVREMASSAKAFLAGVEAVYTQYLAERDAHPGMLPAVKLKKTTPIKSGSGDKTSTNYQPTFEIVQWKERPADLVHRPKGGGAPAPQAATPASAPPSTGAKPAAAPARQPEPAMADDDFG